MSTSNPILKVMLCGSVDDGKSTLIGRLLYDSGKLYSDTLAKLKQDSKQHGTQDEELDFALLVDGLHAEREQGITIDVAYRYFDLDDKRIMLLDSPGHIEYTRNMASATSMADVALLMVDAKLGLQTQSKRHAYLCDLFGIKEIIVLVNKMDEVSYKEICYDTISSDFIHFADNANLSRYSFIPISALKGDNILSLSKNMPWYQNETLIEKLMRLKTKPKDAPGVLPIQWVNRPNANFRGFSGTLAQGNIEKGQRVIAYPLKEGATVTKILQHTQEFDNAAAGDAITLTLDKELDLSRGSVLSDKEASVAVANQFATMLLWLDKKALISGREYIFAMAHQTALCTTKKPKYILDIDSQMKLAGQNLKFNEIGSVQIALNTPVNFIPYHQSRTMGGFILIDRVNFNTVACGMIKYALYRATNVIHQDFDIDMLKRQSLKGHDNGVIWMTGLSSAGKSTIANIVEKKLFAKGVHTITLDGDNIRHGLNRDLGFTEAERAENIRRIAEVAKLMCEAGLITIVSFISPFRLDRETAKHIIGEDKFIEVHIDAPLKTAEERDAKGLYKKARRGEIANFTGIDSPYEAPLNPEIYIDTTKTDAQKCADQIIDHLAKNLL